MPVRSRSRLIAQHRDIAQVGVPGTCSPHRVFACRRRGCGWNVGGVEHSEGGCAREVVWLGLRFDIHGFEARRYFHRKNRSTGMR